LSDVDRGISLGEPRAVEFAHRASIHFMMENYADARGDFTSALRLSPDEASYYIGRGFARFRIGDRENIIAEFLDFRKAFDLDPANSKYRPLFERLGFFKTAI
jgi:Flp pilus assembly protein TadD